MTHLRICLAAVLLGTTAASADIRQLSLTTNDLVYDPGTHRIYASVPSSAGAGGNSITSLDPVTGQVGPSVFVGSEPGKLAVSDDGQYLYVGLDGAAAVRRFDLKTQTAGPQFPLGSGQLPGPAHAGQIQVMPGHPQTIAVVLRDVGYSPSAEGVAIYDNGVQRPKTTSWTDFIGVITFGRSADRLYGYESESSGAEFIRMAVDASGLTILDKAAAGPLGLQMQFADGRIYGSSGLVVDPDTRQLVGSFKGLGFSYSVAPDPAAGRVYFLTQGNPNSTWALLTFDPHTFLPLGTMTLPGVNGTAGSLIRWGQERADGGGLAFRTDQGQVFLLRPSVSAPPAPAAGVDLALSGTAAPDPVAQGANLTLSLTVTNTSSSPATGVVLTESLSAPLMDEIVSTSSSQGQCRQSGSQIVCDLGTLTGGARASSTLVLKPGAASPAAIASWTSTASVIADEPDPNPSNNRLEQRVTLLPRGGAPPAGIRQLALNANDLVYDPVTHEIYASTPSSAGAGGNSIVSVDPVSGKIDAPVFIGSEPGKLALSGDGQYLYVSLDGAAAVRRFDTGSRMAGPQFALGADSFFGPYYVEDMAVMPGNPDVVAISRKNLGVSPRHAGVAIYDHGVARGKMTQRHTGSNVIEFSDSPNRLYGYNNETTEFGFRRLTVDASGVTEQDVTDQLISGFGVDIRYDGGLLFSTSGREIDPEARKLLGTFNGLGARTLVAPDVKAGRVYFLVGDSPVPTPGATWKLLTFDPKTFLMVGSQDVPGVMGAAHSLIRWGQERADGGGLAFATDQGQVFLISVSPPAAPPAPPALVSVSLAPDSITVRGVDTVTARVTLTGPAPAGGFPVSLSSSRPAIAGLPPTLTVPAGALTASTAVTVSGVNAPTDVVITASAGGITRAATLHIDPPPPPPDFSMTLSPSSVSVEGTVTATITLTAPAPPGGYGVSLSSSNPALASVPDFLPLPAGVLTASAPVTVHAGHIPPTDVQIFASIGGESRLATLHINPPPPPAQLALYPNPVPGGLLALGQLTLPQAAGSGGVTVTLSSSSPAAVVPAAVFVPAGASTVTFPIVTFPVAAPTAVTITASGPGGPVTAVLQLLPVAGPPSPVANPPVPAAAPLAAPTNLSARILAPEQVQLSWTDNSRDEDAFAIWRKGGGADWIRIGLVPPNTTSFVDRTAAVGATYTYRVRATRGTTPSDWSNEVSVTVPTRV